jgi:tetratricopeptide (TPR) repeat protein
MAGIIPNKNEINSKRHLPVRIAYAKLSTETLPMTEDPMFNEAIEALSKGQRARAKDLLTRLLRANQANPQYWLYMSSAVETSQERIYCLENVLKLDPSNQAARRGLVLLGARSAGDTVKPVPPIKRRWSAPAVEEEIPKTRWEKLYGNKLVRAGFFSGLGILLVGLFWLGFFGVKNMQPEEVVIFRVSITPGLQPTFTATPSPFPTSTPVVRSPTPTFAGPTPLWMFLEVTYTPVPPYVNTPHPVNEAYRTSLRAYARGDWKNMLRYMQQAAQVEPESADVHYYVGEAHRRMEEYPQALKAYELSIKLNESFAPSYLGRALIKLLDDPGGEIKEDLDRALELDPGLVSAYLARAQYWLVHGEPEAALDDLVIVEELFPTSPLLYQYRAQAYLSLQEFDLALENAIEANRLDITLLPAYLTLALAHLETGDADGALAPLDTYLTYEEEDDKAWLIAGRIYYNQGDHAEPAIDALDKALALDPTLSQAYFYRALVKISLDEAQSAVNDLLMAQKLDNSSFWINLELGHALFKAGRPNDAYRQLRSSQDFAETDDQFAALHYWRALALEVIGNPLAAVAEWEALLELPEEAVPAGWRDEAREHLLVLLTPTPTLTRTSTATELPPTPTLTRTPTATKLPLIPTRTPSQTATPSSATPTPTATLTFKTATPSPTATIKLPSPTFTHTQTIKPPSPTPTPR